MAMTEIVARYAGLGSYEAKHNNPIPGAPSLMESEKFLDDRTGGARAFLKCTSTFPPSIVGFDFNPQKIRIQRHQETKQYASSSGRYGHPSGATGGLFQRSTAGDITIDNLIFKGLDTKPRCDQLYSWMSPEGSLVGQAATGVLQGLRAGPAGWQGTATKPTILSFCWGPPMVGFWYDVILRQVSVTYTHFTKSGIPYRATVNLHMDIQPNNVGQLPTNPTSGGLPGRGRHVVTEGDNVQAIAFATYGKPGRWRELAAANDIDDPLRVRPGDVVYLPNDDELGD
jgi:hypothetical protein